ncbi:MAG: alpha-amylase [Pseudarthrobacter sp.]|nr:alpha-amylase [Pseudarthrobacter sp.]
MATSSSPARESQEIQAIPDWWRQSVVYQIYPRSFADADGNGIGDLRGIISRIPYLVSLGVDAVWLSPFYPSALADGGYDVDDYRDVHPEIGSLEDFDSMVRELHNAGIRVMVDIVPNHTSSRHEWFREALVSPKGSAARERYVFRDGTGPCGKQPPSDWESVFGGSAWEPAGDGQWYLHLFAKEQPDLNWDHPEVRADFRQTLRFWADRGVDGFRVDVAHGLSKKLDQPFVPQGQLVQSEHVLDGSHPFWDRDEVHQIYAEWRSIFNEYSPPRTAVAEVWVHSSRRARYASRDGLGQAFNFDLVQADFNPAEYRKIIDDNLGLAALTGSSPTWVLSNHDVVRHATRYGLPRASGGAPQNWEWLRSNGTTPVLDKIKGLRRARAATLLMLALPGSAYLFQGEELGLHEVADIPDAARQDPMFFRSDGAEKGRDGCRVPLPWTSHGPSLGFGGAGAHLPQPRWFSQLSVEWQAHDPGSTLNLYRQALQLRRCLQGSETLEWLTAEDAVLRFVRPNGWQSITNFSDHDVDLPDGEVLLSSRPLTSGRIPADTTVWLASGSHSTRRG